MPHFSNESEGVNHHNTEAARVKSLLPLYLRETAATSESTTTDLSLIALLEDYYKYLSNHGMVTKLEVVNSGSSHSDATGLAITGGSGEELTVNVETGIDSPAGRVINAVVNNPGLNYRIGDIVTLNNSSGDDATFKVIDINAGPTNVIADVIPEHDPDLISDDFINKFKQEIAKTVPEAATMTKKSLYKKIHQFYKTRGSEESIKAFFKIFFNADVELFKPKDYLFKPSDASFEDFSPGLIRSFVDLDEDGNIISDSPFDSGHLTLNNFKSGATQTAIRPDGNHGYGLTKDQIFRAIAPTATSQKLEWRYQYYGNDNDGDGGYYDIKWDGKRWNITDQGAEEQGGIYRSYDATGIIGQETAKRAVFDGENDFIETEDTLTLGTDFKFEWTGVLNSGDHPTTYGRIFGFGETTNPGSPGGFHLERRVNTSIAQVVFYPTNATRQARQFSFPYYDDLEHTHVLEFSVVNGLSYKVDDAVVINATTNQDGEVWDFGQLNASPNAGQAGFITPKKLGIYSLPINRTRKAAGSLKSFKLTVGGVTQLEYNFETTTFVNSVTDISGNGRDAICNFSLTSDGSVKPPTNADSWFGFSNALPIADDTRPAGGLELIEPEINGEYLVSGNTFTKAGDSTWKISKISDRWSITGSKADDPTPDTIVVSGAPDVGVNGTYTKVTSGLGKATSLDVSEDDLNNHKEIYPTYRKGTGSVGSAADRFWIGKWFGNTWSLWDNQEKRRLYNANNTNNNIPPNILNRGPNNEIINDVTLTWSAPSKTYFRDVLATSIAGVNEMATVNWEYVLENTLDKEFAVGTVVSSLNQQTLDELIASSESTLDFSPSEFVPSSQRYDIAKDSPSLAVKLFDDVRPAATQLIHRDRVANTLLPFRYNSSDFSNLYQENVHFVVRNTTSGDNLHIYRGEYRFDTLEFESPNGNIPERAVYRRNNSPDDQYKLNFTIDITDNARTRAEFFSPDGADPNLIDSPNFGDADEVALFEPNFSSNGNVQMRYNGFPAKVGMFANDMILYEDTDVVIDNTDASRANVLQTSLKTSDGIGKGVYFTYLKPGKSYYSNKPLDLSLIETGVDNSPSSADHAHLSLRAHTKAGKNFASANIYTGRQKFFVKALSDTTVEYYDHTSTDNCPADLNVGAFRTGRYATAPVVFAPGYGDFKMEIRVRNLSNLPIRYRSLFGRWRDPSRGRVSIHVGTSTFYLIAISHQGGTVSRSSASHSAFTQIGGSNGDTNGRIHFQNYTNGENQNTYNTFTVERIGDVLYQKRNGEVLAAYDVAGHSFGYNFDGGGEGSANSPGKYSGTIRDTYFPISSNGARLDADDDINNEGTAGNLDYSHVEYISVDSPSKSFKYEFDEGSGTTLIDKTGNGNNGTIHLRNDIEQYFEDKFDFWPGSRLINLKAGEEYTFSSNQYISPLSVGEGDIIRLDGSDSRVPAIFNSPVMSVDTHPFSGTPLTRTGAPDFNSPAGLRTKTVLLKVRYPENYFEHDSPASDIQNSGAVFGSQNFPPETDDGGQPAAIAGAIAFKNINSARLPQLIYVRDGLYSNVNNPDIGIDANTEGVDHGNQYSDFGGRVLWICYSYHQKDQASYDAGDKSTRSVFVQRSLNSPGEHLFKAGVINNAQHDSPLYRANKAADGQGSDYTLPTALHHTNIGGHIVGTGKVPIYEYYLYDSPMNQKSFAKICATNKVPSLLPLQHFSSGRDPKDPLIGYIKSSDDILCSTAAVEYDYSGETNEDSPVKIRGTEVLTPLDTNLVIRDANYQEDFSPKTDNIPGTTVIGDMFLNTVNTFNNYDITLNNLGGSDSPNDFNSIVTSAQANKLIFGTAINDGRGLDQTGSIARRQMSDTFIFANELSDYTIITPYKNNKIDINYIDFDNNSQSPTLFTSVTLDGTKDSPGFTNKPDYSGIFDGKSGGWDTGLTTDQVDKIEFKGRIRQRVGQPYLYAFDQRSHETSFNLQNHGDGAGGTAIFDGLSSLEMRISLSTARGLSSHILVQLNESAFGGTPTLLTRNHYSSSKDSPNNRGKFWNDTYERAAVLRFTPTFLVNNSPTVAAYLFEKVPVEQVIDIKIEYDGQAAIGGGSANRPILYWKYPHEANTELRKVIGNPDSPARAEPLINTNRYFNSIEGSGSPSSDFTVDTVADRRLRWAVASSPLVKWYRFGYSTPSGRRQYLPDTDDNTHGRWKLTPDSTNFSPGSEIIEHAQHSTSEAWLYLYDEHQSDSTYLIDSRGANVRGHVNLLVGPTFNSLTHNGRQHSSASSFTGFNKFDLPDNVNQAEAFSNDFARNENEPNKLVYALSNRDSSPMMLGHLSTDTNSERFDPHTEDLHTVTLDYTNPDTPLVYKNGVLIGKPIGKTRAVETNNVHNCPSNSPNNASFTTSHVADVQRIDGDSPNNPIYRFILKQPSVNLNSPSKIVVGATATSVPDQIVVSGFTNAVTYANGTYTKQSGTLGGKSFWNSNTGNNQIKYAGTQWQINDNAAPGTFATNPADTDLPPKSGYTLSSSFDGIDPEGTPALSYALYSGGYNPGAISSGDTGIDMEVEVKVPRSSIGVVDPLNISEIIASGGSGSAAGFNLGTLNISYSRSSVLINGKHVWGLEGEGDSHKEIRWTGTAWAFFNDGDSTTEILAHPSGTGDVPPRTGWTNGFTLEYNTDPILAGVGSGANSYGIALQPNEDGTIQAVARIKGDSRSYSVLSDPLERGHVHAIRMIWNSPTLTIQDRGAHTGTYVTNSVSLNNEGNDQGIDGRFTGADNTEKFEIGTGFNGIIERAEYTESSPGGNTGFVYKFHQTSGLIVNDSSPSTPGRDGFLALDGGHTESEAWKFSADSPALTLGNGETSKRAFNFLGRFGGDVPTEARIGDKIRIRAKIRSDRSRTLTSNLYYGYNWPQTAPDATLPNLGKSGDPNHVSQDNFVHGKDLSPNTDFFEYDTGYLTWGYGYTSGYADSLGPRPIQGLMDYNIGGSSNSNFQRTSAMRFETYSNRASRGYAGDIIDIKDLEVEFFGNHFSPDANDKLYFGTGLGDREHHIEKGEFHHLKMYKNNILVFNGKYYDGKLINDMNNSPVDLLPLYSDDTPNYNLNPLFYVDSPGHITHNGITPRLWKFTGRRPFALILNSGDNEAILEGQIRNDYGAEKIKLVPGTVFSSNESRLSDVYKIQDMNYFQEYSYEIRSELDPAVYEKPFEQFIHPAGFKYFTKQVDSPNAVDLNP